MYWARFEVRVKTKRASCARVMGYGTQPAWVLEAAMMPSNRKHSNSGGLENHNSRRRSSDEEGHLIQE